MHGVMTVQKCRDEIENSKLLIIITAMSEQLMHTHVRKVREAVADPGAGGGGGGVATPPFKYVMKIIISNN